MCKSKTALVVAVALAAVGILAPSSLAQPPAAEGRAVAVEDRSLARRFDAGRKWAVVIGVNRYLDPVITSLEFCVPDAQRVAETLAGKCGYENERILLITDDQPQDHLRPLGINLRKQIAGWLKNARPGDTALVFFSGHGFLDARGQGFLAPKDCERENLGLTGFRIDDLRDMLSQCKATQKLLVLDCCHAGGVKEGDPPGPSSEQLGEAFQNASGLITLASCSKKQVSHEWKDRRLGLFTYFLTQGLEGGADFDRNGLVDSDELYRYTSDKVSITAQRVLNARQTPVRFIPPSVVGIFPLARVSLPAEPMTDRLPVTASFHVLRGAASGPPLEGAKVELFYRPGPATRPVALGTAASDETGYARIAVELSLAQQARGEFLVTAALGQSSNVWKLPKFPQSRSYSLYLDLPVQEPAIPASPSPRLTGKAFTNSIGMKFVLIPAGEFMMGSPESEEDHSSDGQQHRVRITKPFYLGVYEVTQEQYERVMGENPSYFSRTGRGKDHVTGRDARNHPVEQVSWDDAVEFCRKLSTREGRTYRLPTEAEWEYACRAGTQTPFHFGSQLNGREANCDGKYPYGTQTKGPYFLRTTEVGFYRPNAWGLYDMHGNVWEWCQDWCDGDYYDDSPTDDPQGPTSGSFRVNRGGGWGNPARYCRSANRVGNLPGNEREDLGFRAALVPAD